MIGNEPAGQWMRNSAVDNPRFLATTMISFLGLRKNAAPRASYADAHRAPTVEKAEYLFHSRCAACHTIGRGAAIGPDLLGVTERRDRGWLCRYIAHPDRGLASGDPIAKQLLAKYHDVRMPDLELSQEEVGILLGYLEEKSRPVAVKNAAMP